MLIVPVTEVHYRQLLSMLGKESMAVGIRSTTLRADRLNAAISSVHTPCASPASAKGKFFVT
jgi:hypothetical protein